MMIGRGGVHLLRSALTTIRNCTALDATVFTLNYQVPAERWLSAFWRTPSDSKLTWVTGNYVVLADADVVKRDWVTGIHSDFRDARRGDSGFGRGRAT
jgi:hypothetical protein